jgi:lactoylglutathione lyase
MKLNHIGFGVTDVTGTVEMLEHYFGMLRAPETPFSTKMAFMLDDDGSLISFFKKEDAVYPEIFHIGFMQDNTEKVYALHEKLKAGGMNPGDIREEFGRMTFYTKAPGNFVIEVNSLIEAARPQLKSQVNDN